MENLSPPLPSLFKSLSQSLPQNSTNRRLGRSRILSSPGKSVNVTNGSFHQIAALMPKLKEIGGQNFYPNNKDNNFKSL